MKLGIDIGGTTISLGLVEANNVCRKIHVPSFPSQATQAETLTYLGDRIAELLDPEVESIGIGVPSLTDPDKGIVYNAANIPSWDIVPLKEKMEARFGISVRVNNDANCYALGASLLTDTPELLVAVTLGTGTGVGIVSKGSLLCGPHCGAGEIGALPYLDGDYESYCSKKFFHSRGFSPRDAAKAAENGDAEGFTLYKAFGKHLGAFLSVVMYAYDPDCIVLGGGISHSFSWFSGPMLETLHASYPYKKALDDLRIVAMPDEEVALLGAASL